MKHHHALLEIKSLCLKVHLGLSEEERKSPQQVSFDITIRFAQAPAAEQDDHLGPGGLCYFKICEALEDLVRGRSFSLIEGLAHQALKTVKKLVPEKTSVCLSVLKPRPPVKNLKGGVRYTTGDVW